MKRIIKQLRLAIFVWLVVLAMKFVPKDCTETLKWLRDIPFEE